MPDQLSALYQDLLDGTYDCVDRIVLNAYFRPGHNPGGFRVWWRRLTGSDASLDNAHLMCMAGRFSRRVRAYAKAHGIPLIDCSVHERKHELAEKHLETPTVTEGVFLILVGKAQAPVWDVSGKHHLERKRPIPYVNHYSFHILDRNWGHLTIKISGHPPFPEALRRLTWRIRCNGSAAPPPRRTPLAGPRTISRSCVAKTSSIASTAPVGTKRARLA
jgi:hypothetical protein